jgi:hypothetical protein
MIAIIDPYLLHFDEERGIEPIGYDQLADVVWMLARERMVVPDEVTYWQPMVVELLRRLAARMSGEPRYKNLLDRLKDRVAPVALAPLVRGIELTDFDRMFDLLGRAWGQRMRQIVSRSALTEETILVTRLIEPRNARSCHHDGRLALVEKLCWELRINAAHQLHRVACICSSRNHRVAWTRRYADGLPGHEDGSDFPFCPPEEWLEPSCVVWRGHESRPTWVDRLSHFWAEPAAQQATGTSYHWDVYLSDTTTAEYGLDQLNIGRWRSSAATDGEPAPGAFHHVPEGKKGRFKKKTGWAC